MGLKSGAIRLHLVGGFNPSEKYDFVSWDDDIPNIWKVINFMFQTTNQICTIYIYYKLDSTHPTVIYPLDPLILQGPRLPYYGHVRGTRKLAGDRR